MHEKIIENARITDTMLGIEDHGIMTFILFCEFQSGCCGFGGYALDDYDKAKGQRIGVGKSLDAIKQIIDVVGVESWEDLKGKHIRVEHTGLGGTVERIGNVIQDKWFCPKDFFESEKKEQ